ncbi:MAG TPA: SRPBCC domain-containing protein [Steroidobacteraceae bacterium]|nr:SRPBCC domain-containing protein [Steroidobacteraceae bacterium]
MTSPQDPTTLELRRVFDASPTAVFDAWMTREEFAAWIGPEGMQCEVPVLEPRVDGRYEITMRLANGQVLPVSGIFKLIERPRRLIFSWGWNADPTRQSLITLEFIPRGARTELVLRQEGLGTIGNRDDHGKGWNSALNKLERHLAAR